MCAVVRVSGQSSDHHGAECAHHHHGGLVPAARQSVVALPKRYNFSWPHLHKVDMGCACSGLETSIEGDQGTGLLMGADNEIGIIRIDQVLDHNSDGCIKCDIQKTDGY